MVGTMIVVEPNRAAQLVAGIYSPRRATVEDCLAQWALLDGGAKTESYLVIDGSTPGQRHTLGSAGIAALAAQDMSSGQLVLR